MSMVYSARLGGAAKKAVALKMADCANDEGESIFPSLDTIAYDTEMSRSSVQRVIKQLLEVGVISVTKDGGGRRPTEYRLNIRKIMSMVKLNRQRGQALNRQRGQALTTEPSLNHQSREKIIPFNGRSKQSGGVPRNTEETFDQYSARMIREGKWKPMRHAARE
mgnify:CR=1 FL=1